MSWQHTGGVTSFGSGAFTFDFLLELAKGNVAGHTLVHKFGENPDIDTVTFEDVWDGGGNANANALYDFATAGETLYISSSNAGDTQDIDVIGLDANLLDQSQVQTLAGQTKTEVGSGLTWLRSFRAVNVGSSDLAGDVYIYADDTVVGGVPQTPGNIRAIITQGNNQTLMAIYTVPADKTGYLTLFYASLSRRQTAVSTARLFVRPQGQVFQLKSTIDINSAGGSHIIRPYQSPAVISAGSDIVMRANSSAADNGVSAGFDLILVEN